MFVWTMALRFLKEGKQQSVLIVIGASVGVAVMVFLAALIDGVQTNLIDKTLGSIAHLTVSEGDTIARPLLHDAIDESILRTVQPPAQRLSSIADWPTHLKSLAEIPGIEAVAPLLSGPGVALKGQGRESVVINGVDMDSYNRVIPITPSLVKGRAPLQGNEVMIGVSLAQKLGITVGDKVRLNGLDQRSTVLTVSGIFDLENTEANTRWLFVSLTSAQTLLDLQGGVSVLLARVSDIFQAELLTRQAAWRTGLHGESWMERNTELLSALQSQDSSSVMIQFFVVLAVALGIASVLYVSVVQKSKEIGILKAMGAKSPTVIKIFVAEGLMVGFLGAVVGCGLGAVLAIAFRDLSIKPDGSPLLPIVLTAPLFIRSALVAFVCSGCAGIAPAKRASRLDPVEVIRNG